MMMMMMIERANYPPLGASASAAPPTSVIRLFLISPIGNVVVW